MTLSLQPKIIHLSTRIRDTSIRTRWQLIQTGLGVKYKRLWTAQPYMGCLCHTLSPQDSGVHVEEETERTKKQ